MNTEQAKQIASEYHCGPNSALARFAATGIKSPGMQFELDKAGELVTSWMHGLDPDKDGYEGTMDMLHNEMKELLRLSIFIREGDS